MAKKKTVSWGFIFSIICFASLFLAGLTSVLLKCGITWSFLNALQSIASLLLTVCVIIAAWPAVAGTKGYVWKIIYAVCAVLALVGGALGF